MAMKQKSGTKSKTIGGMLNVFQSTFSRSEMKQCLESTLAKLRGLCKYLADSYSSNSHVCGLHCLTFVCENKAGKSMQWGGSSFQKCIKKSSALSHIKYGEVSLQIEFATLPPKNHDLFVKEERKRELEKQGKCGHRLIVHSITRRGEIWGGGMKWRDRGRGGGAGGSFVPTYIWAGWNGMTIHILFNSY